MKYKSLLTHHDQSNVIISIVAIAYELSAAKLFKSKFKSLKMNSKNGPKPTPPHPTPGNINKEMTVDRSFVSTCVGCVVSLQQPLP